MLFAAKLSLSLMAACSLKSVSVVTCCSCCYATACTCSRADLATHQTSPDIHGLSFMLQALADEAQCLFLRLFLRKGPWFRSNTLSYSELTDIPRSAQQLCQAGMATSLYSFAPGQGASHVITHIELSPAAADSTPAAASRVTADEQSREATGCCLTEAASCSAQLVGEVADALTVAELQPLIGKLELGSQGRVSGISKGQMLQLLKAGLEKAADSPAEVGSLMPCCTM